MACHRKVARHSRLEERDQFRLHVSVIIRDIEAYDPPVAQYAAIAPLYFGAMHFFHHDNHIRPGDQFGSQWIFSCYVGSGGIHFNVIPQGEDLLGSRAAQAVLAANEQDMFQTANAFLRQDFRGDRAVGWVPHPILIDILGQLPFSTRL